MKRFFEHAGNVRRAIDQIAVLGKRLRRAGDIRLLKHIAPQQVAAHLTGDDHQRDGIHIRRRDTSQQVGSTGAGGRDAHPHPTGNAGITAGGVGGVLLGAHQHVVQRAFRELIVERADGGTGISVQNLDAFRLQTAYHRCSPGHHTASAPSPLNLHSIIDLLVCYVKTFFDFSI